MCEGVSKFLRLHDPSIPTWVDPLVRTPIFPWPMPNRVVHEYFNSMDWLKEMRGVGLVVLSLSCAISFRQTSSLLFLYSYLHWFSECAQNCMCDILPKRILMQCHILHVWMRMVSWLSAYNFYAILRAIIWWLLWLSLALALAVCCHRLHVSNSEKALIKLIVQKPNTSSIKLEKRTCTLTQHIGNLIPLQSVRSLIKFVFFSSCSGKYKVWKSFNYYTDTRFHHRLSICLTFFFAQSGDHNTAKLN